MCVKDVVIHNQVGLHARPATFFRRLTNTSHPSGLKRTKEK